MTSAVRPTARAIQLSQPGSDRPTRPLTAEATRTMPNGSIARVNRAPRSGS